MVAPRGRGRPKRIIPRHDDHALQVLKAAFEVDNELLHLSPEANQSKVSEEIKVEDLCDAITGRHFGTLPGELDDSFDISALSAVRKAIDRDQFSQHDDGEELFRLLCCNQNSLSYIFSATADEPTFNQAMNGPEKENWVKAVNVEIQGCLLVALSSLCAPFLTIGSWLHLNGC